jgi:iron complex transport system permease protein
LAALVLVAVASLSFGSSTLSLSQVLSDPQAQMIVFDIRLPRFIFSAVIGGALAVIGVTYQSLFRNPLASPFTLGVSSGAALGASLALVLPQCGGAVESGAILGAALSIFVIRTISRRLPVEGGGALLLVGIVFSFFCSSLLTMLQYLSDYSQLFRVSRWMMGGVPIVGLWDLMIGVLGLMLFTLWVMRRHREFDLMLFGDDLASVKGADVRQLYDSTFILSSLLIGWIVAKCGVIGFVGIVVPAMVRLLVGLSHRRVVPLACLLGALLVSLCDLLGRVVRPPFEVPAGVFTSVLGGPIFILLAIRGVRRLR